MKVYWVTGGIGKQMCAAAALRHEWEQTGEKVRVLTGWTEVWANMPFVEKAVNPDMDGYDAGRELCEGGRVVRPEPYLNLDFREQRIHLIGAFCADIGLNGTVPVLPYVEITKEERSWATEWLTRCLTDTKRSDREPVLIQPFGLKPMEGQRRSLSHEDAQYLVDCLDERGYVVIQSRAATDLKLMNVITPDLRLRLMIALVTAFEKIVTVDTWLAHAVAALGKRALVFYGATGELTLGYKTNRNVAQQCKLCEGDARCVRPDIVLPDNFVCPYNGKCMKWGQEKIREHVGGYLDAVH